MVTTGSTKPELINRIDRAAAGEAFESHAAGPPPRNDAEATVERDVLQVVASNDRRGAEVFAVDLARALGDRHRTIRTVALAPGHNDRQLDVPVLGKRRLGFGTLDALRDEARRARFVIAHGSTTLPACALATAGTGIPFVYRNIGDPAHWGATRARRTRSMLLLRRPTAVVALTEATARQLAFRYRVNPDRIRVIPKGVPAERFPPTVGDATRKLARRSFGLGNDAVVTLCVGALSPEKNFSLAVAAVAALPEVQLLIVGDGPERALLEAEAARRAPGRVRFAGAVADASHAYAAADAVVLSSWSEGLPGVLIEAGLSGLPVVATDVGFVDQIVVHDETGLLVPAGDRDAMSAAVAKALRDRVRLGQAARAHCLEHFDLATVADKWDSLIGETLGPAWTDRPALV
ncbi:MAG: glycosyltransferase family 4 protein [Acidimicrobiia bacterium]